MPGVLDGITPHVETDVPTLISALASATTPQAALSATLSASDYRSLAVFRHIAQGSDALQARQEADGALAYAMTTAASRIRPPPTGPTAGWAAAHRRRARPRSGDGEWHDAWWRIDAEVRLAVPSPTAPLTLRDRADRFVASRGAWAPHLEAVAEIATHVMGHRVSHLDRVGGDVMDGCLRQNAVGKATVEAMLGACRDARPALHRYLRARGRALGVPQGDRLPIGVRHQLLPDRAEATDFGSAFAKIIERFGAFSPRLGALARRARAEGWVDAEVRPGKVPLATCVHFSAVRQSRICVAYDGSPDAVVTLAHELGHAYHADVLYRHGPSLVDLPRSLAEGASLVTEGLIRPAAGASDPVSALDGYLSGAAKWMLDAPQTLELELAMIALRRAGPLDPATLEEAATRAQREWFGPDPVEVDRDYWASQFMLYSPVGDFLALPYLVAFLFASRVQAVAEDRGAAFADAWDALLSDCEIRSLEEVAARHLDLDTTQPGAFDPVVAHITDQVAAFEALV